MSICMSVHSVVEESPDMKLKEDASLLFPGDLCPGCLVSLQSAAAAGGPGCCQLLLSAPRPAHRDDLQEDAQEMEGDG